MAAAMVPPPAAPAFGAPHPPTQTFQLAPPLEATSVIGWFGPLALVAAMTPIVDSTKTVGLISLPGAMTGMILAGASPMDAVQLQLIVMYMLLGANTFTGLIAAYLTYRQFFTRAHQLVTLIDRDASG